MRAVPFRVLRYKDGAYGLFFDLKPFADHNKTVAVPDWYDKDGELCLK